MSDQQQNGANARRGFSLVTIAATVLVLVLALGALLWPRSSEQNHTHTLLVFDASGDQARVKGVFRLLQAYLETFAAGPLELVVVRTAGEFQLELATAPDFVLAPDGLALQIPVRQYLPLVAGRRPAPRNLRPRGVLVYRKSAGDAVEPWRTRAAATVFGDSLSLTAVGVIMSAGKRDLLGDCTFGPDPYDHGPALHALRLKAFDYAVVRQWDAERFFADGLLTSDQFGVRDLIVPVPDVVLMVSREVPRHVRLRSGEGLSSLGRHPGHEAPLEGELCLALPTLHLAGFNLLLEPDFELVRKIFPGDWLPETD